MASHQSAQWHARDTCHFGDSKDLGSCVPESKEGRPSVHCIGSWGHGRRLGWTSAAAARSRCTLSAPPPAELVGQQDCTKAGPGPTVALRLQLWHGFLQSRQEIRAGMSCTLSFPLLGESHGQRLMKEGQHGLGLGGGLTSGWPPCGSSHAEALGERCSRWMEGGWSQPGEHSWEWV